MRSLVYLTAKGRSPATMDVAGLSVFTTHAWAESISSRLGELASARRVPKRIDTLRRSKLLAGIDGGP